MSCLSTSMRTHTFIPCPVTQSSTPSCSESLANSRAASASLQLGEVGAPARTRTLFPRGESARKSARAPCQAALQLEQRRRSLLEIRTPGSDFDVLLSN